MRVDLGYYSPLYTIKYYGNDIYRVVKRCCDPGVRIDDSPKKELSPEEQHIGKFASALSRAKNVCREYCLCNDWEYFVTITLDEKKVPSRYDLKAILKEMMQFIQNENKKGANIKYVLIPEFHEDGAVHLHGLMSGICVAPRPDWWPKSVNLKGDGSYYDHCPLFSDRYGFTSVDPVRDNIAVGFYCSKYITKSMAELSEYYGVHTYYHSRGLQRARVTAFSYWPSDNLDRVCKFENSFYKFGFCRGESLVDEELEMYSDWIITDENTGEVVAIVGGDDEDPGIQEVIQGYELLGRRCLRICS